MPRMVKIRLIAAGGVRHPMSGQWVVRYDPEYHLPSGEYDGGYLVCTEHRGEATEYELEDAFRLWQSGPSCECHRTREDGEPNRPLSAFSVAIG